MKIGNYDLFVMIDHFEILCCIQYVCRVFVYKVFV